MITLLVAEANLTWTLPLPTKTTKVKALLYEQARKHHRFDLLTTSQINAIIRSKYSYMMSKAKGKTVVSPKTTLTPYDRNSLTGDLFIWLTLPRSTPVSRSLVKS